MMKSDEERGVTPTSGLHTCTHVFQGKGGHFDARILLASSVTQAGTMAGKAPASFSLNVSPKQGG